MHIGLTVISSDAHQLNKDLGLRINSDFNQFRLCISLSSSLFFFCFISFTYPIILISSITSFHCVRIQACFVYRPRISKSTTNFYVSLPVGILHLSGWVAFHRYDCRRSGVHRPCSSQLFVRYPLLGRWSNTGCPAVDLAFLGQVALVPRFIALSLSATKTSSFRRICRGLCHVLMGRHYQSWSITCHLALSV